MKLKQIFTYPLWLLLSLLIGILYMRILLGPIDMSSKGFAFLRSLFFAHGIFYVGLIVGSIIAIVFILLDIFYLKKKLENHSKRIYIRFGILLVVAFLVFVMHFILEKVIDVI